jgi:tetratricopeptide (TPR) repeat protein
VSLLDGDYQAALERANIYISYQFESPEGWTLLGRAYTGLGNNQDALTALDRAIELKPPTPDEALIARGLAQLYLGEPELAAADFERARFSLINWLQIGQAYYAVGDYENALVYFERILSADKTGFETNYWYGAALVGNGQFADALEPLETALSKANSDLRRFDVFYQLGKAQAGLNDREEAIQSMRDALELNITGRDTERAEAALTISRLGGQKVTATQTPAPLP